LHTSSDMLPPCPGTPNTITFPSILFISDGSQRPTETSEPAIHILYKKMPPRRSPWSGSGGTLKDRAAAAAATPTLFLPRRRRLTSSGKARWRPAAAGSSSSSAGRFLFAGDAVASGIARARCGSMAGGRAARRWRSGRQGDASWALRPGAWQRAPPPAVQARFGPVLGRQGGDAGELLGSA
jgi:hypothetical protein